MQIFLKVHYDPKLDLTILEREMNKQYIGIARIKYQSIEKGLK